MQTPLKILHTADFNYSRENQEKALISLETVCDKAEKEEVQKENAEKERRVIYNPTYKTLCAMHQGILSG